MPACELSRLSSSKRFCSNCCFSTECFRDYWSAPAMRAFMRRSVHLMEELSCSSAENEARIALTKSGYLYVHQDFQSSTKGSAECSRDQCVPLNAGDLQRLYPWLSSDCTHAVFAKNAGWLSAHGLGISLLSSLQECSSGNKASLMVGWDFCGAIGLEDKLQGVIVRNAATKEELQISCAAFVNATGPMLSATHQAALASLSSAVNASLPVHNDLHAKVIFQDVLRYRMRCASHVSHSLLIPLIPRLAPRRVIPRTAPMTILNSPIRVVKQQPCLSFILRFIFLLQVPYDSDMLQFIAENRGEHVTKALQQPMPAGAHFRW